jgi:hypothetical protein
VLRAHGLWYKRCHLSCDRRGLVQCNGPDVVETHSREWSECRREEATSSDPDHCHKVELVLFGYCQPATQTTLGVGHGRHCDRYPR